METIYALASGSMRAGVAVVRISGAGALPALAALSSLRDIAPRVARLATLRDPRDGALLDRALVIYFQAPASFTGEDVVELHLHGGRAVIEGVMAALQGLNNFDQNQFMLRMAQPGEFTRRAFENGKLDLTEAEAVADLIDAETQAQRLQALDQLGGALSALYQGYADRLTKTLAHIEADIEFPDEDIGEGIGAAQMAEIAALEKDIAGHLDDGRRGERLRDGVRVAIVGAPNAGKSSLLNALARREAAIVSDTAGTTRDVIEVHLDLGGYPVILADTAGLRDTADAVEAEGIRRAAQAAAQSDLKIALFDAGQPRDAETQALVDGRTLVVLSKSDMADGASAGAGHALSARTGAGMEEFLRELTARVARLFENRSGPALTRSRHREALEEARSHLARAQAAALPELAAEDVRMALRALGRITGRVHVEELLDRIFRDFCIGK